ncbi:hypothetical protein GWI33_018887 [Rhynchophorus ferrugineus]|uniref:Galactosyltransferase C-terminal domain-containing protein n=1 Tax=Rhynchophorus ferrugineus TaxID=354439 RepID=A0A834M1Y9_RHYFE|nr:hypothetical protein GWI33_018887 [Rhynchophorus ferrugineus]
MITKCVQCICALVIFIAVYFPSRHARHYDYIHLKDVISELVFNINNKFSQEKNCEYGALILNNTEIIIADVTQTKYFIPPLIGGEFIPQTFTVEQNNTLPFNRAEMMNYGAKIAIESNIYGCSHRPRHMSSSLDTFRYNLPYLTLFGGAISILTSHFKKVNGMSNLFFGWGGEDDNFYNRLESHQILPYRFDPELSRYTMLIHKKQLKNDKRFQILNKPLNIENDGLNRLNRRYLVIPENLFTRIVVN